MMIARRDERRNFLSACDQNVRNFLHVERAERSSAGSPRVAGLNI